jgi:hypothetical protein
MGATPLILSLDTATLRGSACLMRGVGIPTLPALARAARASPATVALLPAGRGELFSQFLSVSPEGVETEHEAAAHPGPIAIIEKYRELKECR